jgi:hypothetical protein
MKTHLPSFSTYGNYSSSNYGAHALKFTDAAGNEFWFSYQTLIAFYGPTGRRVVHQNDWSTTTGKHLNAIDGGDKKSRVDDATFNRLFAETFGTKAAA